MLFCPSLYSRALIKVYKRILVFVPVLAAAVMLWSQIPSVKRAPDAKGNDCAACHQTKSPLPTDHVPTGEFKWTDCKGCHAKGESTSLTGKLPLQHVHSLAGVDCIKCHTDITKPAPVPARVCIGCHQPSKVAAATAELQPTNPHESPHYGEESDCNLCHHQHKKSVNNCEQCHSDYMFNVP